MLVEVLYPPSPDVPLSFFSEDLHDLLTTHAELPERTHVVYSTYLSCFVYRFIVDRQSVDSDVRVSSRTHVSYTFP